MGMSTGGGGGIRSEINVTPLVDVVLVLLIIFMVIIPVLQQGYPVVTPPKNKDQQVVPVAPPDQIIVRLDREGRMWINKEQIDRLQFGSRLKTALTGREDKVVFFAADGELPYGQVAEFLDFVRDSGAKNLGMVFDDIRSR